MALDVSVPRDRCWYSARDVVVIAPRGRRRGPGGAPSPLRPRATPAETSPRWHCSGATCHRQPRGCDPPPPTNGPAPALFVGLPGDARGCLGAWPPEATTVGQARGAHPGAPSSPVRPPRHTAATGRTAIRQPPGPAHPIIGPCVGDTGLFTQIAAGARPLAIIHDGKPRGNPHAPRRTWRAACEWRAACDMTFPEPDLTPIRLGHRRWPGLGWGAVARGLAAPPHRIASPHPTQLAQPEAGT